MTDELKYWFAEIDAAIKRNKDYIKDGKRILEIYECENPDKVPFNILFSNVDTLLPALYSATPRPVISRRFKDADPIGKAASEAGRRLLEYLLDTNFDGYESFGEAMQSAVIDALVPGRGVTAVKYDAEVDEYKGAELICTDSKEWNRVLFGFARKWADVPWLAFEETIDLPEAKRLFGAEMASKIQFTKESDKTDDDQDNDNDTGEDESQGERKTAIIYQIWDKQSKKLRYVSRCIKDEFLKVEDDPLELSGFFPIPKPLELIARSNTFEPSSPYLVYENQANELSELTRRINRLVKAIKAKGVYDSELGDDIANLMTGDDNVLIPAEKSALLSSEKGFDNSIWFMPIEQMIMVLRELYAAREACKMVIYEITGISDIIRGSTNATETATAQNLKSQWGTMRLKRNQGEVARYARDLLRIMLEMASTKYSQQTWAEITSLPYITDEQAMQAQQVVQMVQQRMSMQPPQPGQQTQVPPELQQQYQQAQQIMQQPKWSDVLSVLQNDMMRSYKIDVETNSTIVPEAVEDQKNIADVMNALGQYLQGITPLIEKGAFPFEAAKAMMMSVVRRYQFGSEIEDQINQMKAPPPPEPPQDNSIQVKQMELQAKQQELQAKQQAQQQELAMQKQADQAEQQLELQKIRVNAQIEKEKLAMQRLIEEGRAATDMRIEAMNNEFEAKISAFEARLEAETKLKIAEMQMIQNAMVNTENDDDIEKESE